MPWLVKQSESNAARRRIMMLLVDDVTGLEGVTGVTGTPRIRKPGGVDAACTNAIVEVDAVDQPGVYALDLATAELDNLGCGHLYFKGANCAPWFDSFQVVAFDPFDSVRAGLSAMPNAAAGANGGLPTGDGSGAVKVQSGTGAGQINLSAGNVTLSGVTFPSGFSTLTVGSIADAVWDESIDTIPARGLLSLCAAWVGGGREKPSTNEVKFYPVGQPVGGTARIHLRNLGTDGATGATAPIVNPAT